MKCTKCGSEMSEEKKFCENCGAPLMQNSVSHKKTNVNVDSGKKKNIKAGLIIFICVIVLAVIIGIGCLVNAIKNKVADGLNTLNVMGEFVGGFVNEAQEVEEQVEEEYTNIAWKLPLLKTEGMDAYFTYYSDIKNLEEYDIYTTAVAVSTNDFWVMEHNLNSDNENVKIINRYYTSVNIGDKEETYNLIYILIPKGTDINDVCIYVDKNKEACIYGKDNNVKPIKEKKATYGDCITCTVDGIRTYILLLEFNDNYSRGGSSGNFDILGASVKCVYIVEKIPDKRVYSTDMFKTISKDENILATTQDASELIEEQGIYIDKIPFAYENFCGTFTLAVDYWYKEENMTEVEALKIWKNDKIGIKFMNELEIDWLDKEE